MQIAWESKCGIYQNTNCDAGGYVQCQTGSIAIIVDAAERSPQSNALAMSLVDEVLNIAVVTEDLPSIDKIIQALKEFQCTLRVTYLTEIASYAIVLIDESLSTITILHCGDCRVGVVSKSIDYRAWLTFPHTPSLINIDAGADVEQLCYCSHLVSRSLNAKRFHRPQVTVCPFHFNDNYLIMSTDGYWRKANRTPNLVNFERDFGPGSEKAFSGEWRRRSVPGKSACLAQNHGFQA